MDKSIDNVIHPTNLRFLCGCCQYHSIIRFHCRNPHFLQSFKTYSLYHILQTADITFAIVGSSTYKSRPARIRWHDRHIFLPHARSEPPHVRLSAPGEHAASVLLSPPPGPSFHPNGPGEAISGFAIPSNDTKAGDKYRLLPVVYAHLIPANKNLSYSQGAKSSLRIGKRYIRMDKPRHHGMGRMPSHFTFQVPSLGKPGFLTVQPSQPAHMRATAVNKPPLPGR